MPLTNNGSSVLDVHVIFRVPTRHFHTRQHENTALAFIVPVTLNVAMAPTTGKYDKVGQMLHLSVCHHGVIAWRQRHVVIMGGY